jgi:hypothetical protein
MEKGRAGSPRAGCLPLAELGVLLLRHVFHSIRAEQDVFRTGRVAARRRAIRYQPRGQERRGEDRPVSKPLTAARVAFGFTCRLVYDESGLVLDYPGIAVRAV